jgi:hypothetical protein
MVDHETYSCAHSSGLLPCNFREYKSHGERDSDIDEKEESEDDPL